MPTLRRLVCCSLVVLIASVDTLQAKTIEVRIENLAYVPSSITVEQGDIIRWINNDLFDHTATVEDKWEVMMPAGATVEQLLEKPGAVTFFCRFHPTMNGKLVVKKR